MNRLRRLPIGLLLFALFLSVQPVRAQTTYDLYFLGGQSNMDGFGTNSELPEHLSTHQSGVMKERAAGAAGVVAEVETEHIEQPHRVVGLATAVERRLVIEILPHVLPDQVDPLLVVRRTAR